MRIAVGLGAAILAAVVSTTRADQPPAIDYLGAGYDLVFANPDGSEDAMSAMDPGFRTHLIKFTWDDEFNTCSGLQNNWTCPREVAILPETSCFQQSSSSKISSTKSFQRALQRDCKVSASVKGSYGGFSAEASFSASRAMKSMSDKISKEKVTTYQSKAVCVEYGATLKMGILKNNLETLPQFDDAVTELPSAYVTCFQPDSIGGPCAKRVASGFGDLPPIKKGTRRLADADDADEDDDDEDDGVNNCACHSSVVSYFKFIQLFGTHYTTSVDMGGKIVHRVEIKSSDVQTLEKNKVDVRYGASIKASYDGLVGSASMSVSAKAAKSEASKAFTAVTSVTKKEININIGGSPSEDWREWAKSSSTAPMPIRYQLAPLVDLIAKVDAKKAALFELAVDDYIAAYSTTLSFDTPEELDVVAVEIKYSMTWANIESVKFRITIGKPGDLIPQYKVATSATGAFRIALPTQLRMSFDAFEGNVPVTLEYHSGVFIDPKVMLEAHGAHGHASPHWANMEAAMANRRRRKTSPPAPPTPQSVYFKTIQPFAVMEDGKVVPLDTQYAGKTLALREVWPVNPMD